MGIFLNVTGKLKDTKGFRKSHIMKWLNRGKVHGEGRLPLTDGKSYVVLKKK